MRLRWSIVSAALLLAVALPVSVDTQSSADAPSTPRTVRPVLRGTQYAVSSMKAEATAAAVRILEAGGNAFDAVVAGQAVLSLVDFPSNGIGGDAQILLYDAKARQVSAINAEGAAPRLATIDWYEKNNGAKLPDSDGLLSASTPGVVDAWYLLLDRWGTMMFEQVLRPAIETAEQGFPLSEGLARSIAGSKKIRKYPGTTRLYVPDGRTPEAGEIFRIRTSRDC
jgi:gamma-glutamyltranspeptidase/glutathione hydrolase